MCTNVQLARSHVTEIAARLKQSRSLDDALLLIAAKRRLIDCLEPAGPAHGLATIELAELYAFIYKAEGTAQAWREGLDYFCGWLDRADECSATEVLYRIAFAVHQFPYFIEVTPAAAAAFLQMLDDIRTDIKPGAGSRATVAVMIAELYWAHYSENLHPHDLERAIGAGDDALSGTARDRDRLRGCLVLIKALSSRARLTGNRIDVDKAIALGHSLLRGRDDAADRLAILPYHAAALRWRFAQFSQDRADLDLAIDAYREALALTPEEGEQRACALDSLGNGLQSRFDSGGDVDDLDEAIALTRQAVKLGAVCSPNLIASIYCNLGKSLIVRAAIDSTSGFLEEAQAALEAGLATPPDSPSVAALLRYDLARVALLRHACGADGALDRAIDLADMALATFRTHDLRDLADYRLGGQSSATGCRKCLVGALMLRGRDADIERAVVISEASKARFLSHQARSAAYQPIEGVPSELLEREHDMLQRMSSLDMAALGTGNALSSQDIRDRHLASRTELSQALERLWQAIAATSVAGAAHVAERRSDESYLAQRLRRLPAGQSVLCIEEIKVAGPDHVWSEEVCFILLTITETGVAFANLGRRAEAELEDAQHGFVSEVLSKDRLSPDKETWWRGLAPVLGGVASRDLRHVCVSPSPRSTNLPWILALDRAGWFEACGNLEVSLTPSLLQLCAAVDRRNGPMPPTFYKVRTQDAVESLMAAAMASEPNVVLGNPTGDLPRSVSEALRIADMLGTTALVGPDCTCETVKQRLASPDAAIVHIAGHVDLDPIVPLDSSIRLADGKLKATELLQQAFRPKLIVLSGCSSGVTGRILGNEPMGLVSALLGTGAENVVASLWPVNDRATAFLMAAFHREVKGGSSIAASLRKASLETRKQSGWKSSYYWGAFVLFSAQAGFGVG